jgi:hypothetical protein
MAQVTHEQADLMLRLYEARREPKLREARQWFVASFHPTTFDDVTKYFMARGEEQAFIRMTASYWDMVANYANRGLVDEEFLFETSGEQWIVWERIKPIVAEWRESFKNPLAFSNLEEHAKRLEAWREKRAPGANEHMRQMMARIRAAQTGTAKTAAS